MSRRTAMKPVGWVASRIAGQGLEFLGWVFLARRLGTSGVGVLAVASIVARMLGLVSDWGATFRGPRDVVRAGRDSDLVRGLVRRRQIVSAALATAMLIAVLGSGQAMVAPIVVTVLARGGGRDWIALGENRRRDAAMPLLLQGLLIATAVPFTSSIFTAACAVALGHGAGLVLSIRLNPMRGMKAASRVAADGWYLIAGLADQVLVSSDTALILIIESSVEAGVYTSIYRLPLAWLTLVGLCTAAAVPMAAAAVGAGRTSAADLHRRADRVALLGALAVIPVTGFSLILVVPIFGEEFSTGRTAMVILFMAAATTTASAPYRVLYTAFASDRRVAVVTVGAAMGNLLANLVAIDKWGIEGAATTTFLAQVAMFAFLANWSAGARKSDRQTDPLVVTA